MMNADGVVLHVDPSEADRESVAAAFAPASASLESVPDREAALDALDDGDVDCVVSEAELPEGNGIGLLDEADVPFVFYTDSGDESFAGEVIARGADGYVPKGDGTETLVARIETLFDGDTACATRRPELERTKTIVEAVGDGVYALDSEGRYTTVNDRLLSYTGYTRDELLANTLRSCSTVRTSSAAVASSPNYVMTRPSQSGRTR